MIGKEEKTMTNDGATPTTEGTADTASDAPVNDGTDDAEAAESAPEGTGGEDEPVDDFDDPISALTAEIADTKEQLLRALAETENVRRRAAKDREETRKYAITAFARELLSVADNLRRALDNLPDEARGDESLAGVVSGIEITEREFLSALERNGIRRIDPMGEKFDHNLHQAVFEVADSDASPGTVVQVIQAGYVIADRLLRPAMVGVSVEAKIEAPAEGVDTEA